MPHRIAVIFEYPSLNGGENSMLQTMRAIRAAHETESNESPQFEFIAIAPPTGDLADALARESIEHAAFRSHDEAGKKLSRESLCDELVRMVARLSPDLLHANSLSMARLTGAVQDRLAIPSTAHLRDILKLSRTTVKDINANRAIFAVSSATRDYHVQQGIDESKVSVVYNAVDCQRFKPRPVTGSLRRELNLPADSFITLTVGQIGLRKAQDVLAAAAPRIAQHTSDIHFVIVGQRNSSKAESIAFEQNLSDLFESAGLADRLHLLGYRHDVDHLLNEADLLVHPAKQEPLGRVLLEAAASGLPIVATNVGGTTEIVTDNISARLIPPANAQRLADAVIEMANDPTLRMRFADAARQHMLANFNAQKTGAKLGEVWEQILVPHG